MHSKSGLCGENKVVVKEANLLGVSPECPASTNSVLDVQFIGYIKFILQKPKEIAAAILSYRILWLIAIY